MALGKSLKPSEPKCFCLKMVYLYFSHEIAAITKKHIYVYSML